MSIKIVRYTLLSGILAGVFLLLGFRSVRAADQVYYLHTDQVGSIVTVTDGSGQVVSEKSYQAYGSDKQTVGTNPSERSYTGQIKDTTNLYYYNARYYDPVLSRFISADSVQAGNRYAYVAGNPISNSDPSGSRIAGDEDMGPREGKEKVNALIVNQPIGLNKSYIQEIGTATALYMNDVIKGAGNLKHISLLTPAFNMTSPYVHPIINAMTAAGAKWNSSALKGVAGNAYYYGGKTPAQYVQSALAGTLLANKQVMVTETGIMYDGTTDFNKFASELQKMGRNPKYIGVLLYNAFDTNSGWSQYALSDAQRNQICGSSCGKIGVNSADSYGKASADYYSSANGLKMKYSLEIFSGENEVNRGVMSALNQGITPIIRIGTEYTGGPTATDYVNYLKELDSHLSGNQMVYAIAGPNEPETENWILNRRE